MEFLAAFLGSLAGKLADPVSWILLAAVFSAGTFRVRAFWPAVGAAMVTALTVAVLFSWWKELGIAHQWQQRAMWMFFLYAVIAYVGYGAGLLVPRPGGDPSN